MNGQLDLERIAEIQKILQSRDTEELLEHWQAHDEQEWSPEAFEAMRIILRERLGEIPSRDQIEDRYYCSECGAEVALTDTVCPACGADVAEVNEGAAEPKRAAPESGRVFTELALAFFAEVSRLPEEYAAYLAVSEGDEMLIPARDPKVGDLKVRVLTTLIAIAIGDHTATDFRNAASAVDFIRDVVEGQVVFHFGDAGVELYQINELSESAKMDWNNYVWSGPVRNRQTGSD